MKVRDWDLPTFIDMVCDYLAHDCPDITVEATDADPESREAIYSIRHDGSRLLLDLRVPEAPSFVEAQEWCLGFLSRPLHEVLALVQGRDVPK